jgi:ATPase family associated with various cellular activities (AAA)
MWCMYGFARPCRFCMSEITLKRLRNVRQRAQDLLRFVDADMRPFLHKLDKETFRRKPDSLSTDKDVNVTTTCSCVMALALSNAFRKFYEVENEETKAKDKACSIFNRLVEAPWMSSGLTANNAFSTTLILRTFGFLKGEGLLGLPDIKKKQWELHLGIDFAKIGAFATYLKGLTDETAKFIYTSLSDNGRILLKKPNPTNSDELIRHQNKLMATLALDIRRLIQSGFIYTQTRFPAISDKTKKALANWPTGYDLAQLNLSLFVEQLSEYFAPPSQQDLDQIAARMAKDTQNFAINEYSPTPTVLYWYVDGLERGSISLEGKAWERLCKWATQEFNRQRSLVLANHDAMMDPVAMAMAACLCSKLRNIASRDGLGTDKAHREMLPSMVELEHSIQELFGRQALSGIWPKYFPLFHYQDAGSNFCFTFEMLEAVLSEFGHAENNLLDQENFVKGLEAAMTWCEENRLKCAHDGVDYCGWNSGGDIESLKKEIPESWATAVVHMFLWELINVLSQRIQKRVLQKYSARLPKKSVEKFQEEMRNDSTWKDKNFGNSLEKLQDIEIFIDRQHDSLIRVLKEELLNVNFGKNELQIRRENAKSPISALLFGPPGTSKTQVTKAISDDLGWPMIEINPSEFVKGNFANVYLQAEEIFTDLMDLSGVVVLFDEMDALTQKRSPSDGSKGSSHLDTATQFLTTSMLPKLTALHDKGGVIFFMATNYQENFDSAIKRAGRFDFLLCMGPPKMDEKIKKLECFFDPRPAKDQKEAAEKLIVSYLDGSQKHKNIFELLTFGDCKSLLNRIGNGKNIGDKLQILGKDEFRRRLDNYSETIGLRYQYIQDLGKGDITLREIDSIQEDELKNLLATKRVAGTDIGRYLIDRRESKRQF